MRDRDGVERGRCRHCASEGVECCEFTYPASAGEGETTDDTVTPEAYKLDPMLPCLRARLAASPALAPLASVSTTCDGCGCEAGEHEAVTVTEAEARVLQASRCLFAPFDLSIGVRQSVQDTTMLGIGRETFTYGEVGLLSFLRLLDKVAALRAGLGCPSTGGTFFDLGCGLGKAVVLAALHPISFERCVGVELLPGLAAAASELGSRFRQEEVAFAEAARRGPALVHFKVGDMMKEPLDGAALVLLNAGGWQEPNVTRFRRRLLEALPHLCILLTIRKALAEVGSSELVHLEELHLPMSWGEAPVFLAVRKKTSLASVDLDSLD